MVRLTKYPEPSSIAGMPVNAVGMKWILWTIVALASIVAILAAIGYFMPAGHVATRSRPLNAPPERVFALMSNPGTYQSWWSGATVKSEVVESVPPSRIVTRVVGETQFGGTWTIEIVPAPAGSIMTITERGEIYNPVFRVLAKYLFGYTGTIESCLDAVEKTLAA
jgi:hypothetical protein